LPFQALASPLGFLENNTIVIESHSFVIIKT